MKNSIILLVLTYFFVFSPILPSFEIGSIKFLYFLIPLFFSSKVWKNIKKTKNVLVSYFIWYLYILIRSSLSVHDTTQITYDGIIVLFEDFFIAHLLIYMHDNYNIHILETLRKCMYIAVFSAIICWLSPLIKDVVENYISLPNKVENQDFRGFGIGLEQTFSYSISIAFLYILLLFNDIKNKQVLCLLPFVAFSIMINARTGLIILILGVILFLLKNNYLRSPKIVIIFSVLFVFINNINVSFWGDSDIGLWLTDFVNEIAEVFSGESSDNKSNTITALLSAFDFYLPKTYGEWFFGPGLVVGDEGKIFILDSGFFSELYFGGLVYILLCFFIPIVLYASIRDSHKLYSLFLLISCFILNFKGPFVPMAHGFKLLSLLCIYFILHPCLSKTVTK